MRELKPDEIEDLSPEDRTLGDMLRGLKRVEPPLGFDSRVMTQIADGGPAKTSFLSGFQVPVYAASLVALLIFGGFFVWMSGYFGGGAKPVPPVAGVQKHVEQEGSVSSAAPGGAQPAVNAPAVLNDAANPAEVAIGNANSPPYARHNRNLEQPVPGGGSQDQALSNSEQPVARGFDPNASRTQKVDQDRADVPISEFLSAIGINAAFQGQQLKVSGVRGGSLADKSGVRAGDVIDAIGDTRITPTTKFNGSIQAKSLTVIRDGKSLKVTITA